MHIKHLNQREGIKVNYEAISKRINKYSKKKSKTCQTITRMLSGIRNELIKDEDNYWHKPKVSPFHTKTGRDETLGSAINRLPKVYWPFILKPPDGYAYVLLDYEQQEPAIAAYLANCKQFLDWYAKGDIYEGIACSLKNRSLDRKRAKKLLIAYLYGISETKLAEEFSLPKSLVSQWFKQIQKLTAPIGNYLDKCARDIKLNGVAYSLDWRHCITLFDKHNSLRNWIIQATGADIMRRVCLRFDDAKIPLLLTNHDSFLVKLPKANLSNDIQKAIGILKTASASVLGNFELKAKVEMILPSQD